MTQIRPQPRWASQPQVRAGAPQAAAAGIFHNFILFHFWIVLSHYLCKHLYHRSLNIN